MDGFVTIVGFHDPHLICVVGGSLSFVIIPVFVLFNGKRYCFSFDVRRSMFNVPP